jgi:hypothetical protein
MGQMNYRYFLILDNNLFQVDRNVQRNAFTTKLWSGVS